MTATPERADGLDVLRYFDGRIAAELRVWDAIDQQYLVPFSYFGVHDGTDLTEVPWKRGQGYDSTRLTNVFTADHAWARRVVEQLHELKTADPPRCRALGFCVSVAHARFMAEQFRAARDRSRRRLGRQPHERANARHCATSTQGEVNVVFTVDLFNEGVDVPQRRHAAAAAPDREPDAVPAATRPRPTARRRQGALHGPRLRREPSTRVPLRPAVPRAARRQPTRGRAAGRTRLPVPAGRLPHRARSGRARDRPAQHPRGDPDRVAERVATSSARSATSPSPTYLERAASNSRTSTRTTGAGASCVELSGCRPIAAGRRARRRSSERSADCSTSTTTSARRVPRLARRRGRAPDVERARRARSAPPAHAPRLDAHGLDQRDARRRSGPDYGRIRRSCAELVELLDELDARVDHLHRCRSTSQDVPLARARALHAGRDPGRVRRRDGAPAATWDSGVLVAAARADRPVRVHARQDERLLLADDPLPGLRDQPRADPLGESIGDVARQRDTASATSARPSKARTSCCSLGYEPTTEPSGASAPRPTFATRANGRSRSPGDSTTACPADLYTAFAAAVA